MWWGQMTGLGFGRAEPPSPREKEQEETLARLQGQWFPVRYVSLASLVLSFLGVLLSSRRYCMRNAEPGAPHEPGPALSAR